jgi:ADP-ribosylglycohydrolase
MMVSQEHAILGCLLGTAVGDALGLASEGMSRERQHKMFPTIDRYHFLFGRGMISDDTEHTCMVAQSLIVSAGETERFVKSLAWRFRWWLLGLPAGIGYATLRALLKLWLGFSGFRSGVFSAGNGPAMRSAIIGVCYGNTPDQLRELVRASTRITHTDPKAELGAFAVALAAYLASTHGEKISAKHYLHALQTRLEPTLLSFDQEKIVFLALVERVVKSLEHAQTTAEFAKELGLARGVSGYIYHTLPIVLHSWLRHQHDFRLAVTQVIRCGGDTDTTAAIVGAIVGAGVGKQGIPTAWLNGLWEWPRNVVWLETLAKRLHDVMQQHTHQQALSLPVHGLLLRNVGFMTIVLLHGIRRIFPPY